MIHSHGSQGRPSGISLTCIVPSFNEAEILDDTIGIFIADLESLAPFVRDFEIIIVDDGSTDASPEIARRWTEREPRVKLIRHGRNRGVGAAIISGLEVASKEWMTVDCADRPFDLRDLMKLSNLFVTSDLIIIERQDRRANSPYRKLTSWANYALIRALFRIPVADCQFAQFYKVDLVRGIPIRSVGSLVPPELILKSARRGLRISRYVLPFHARPGGVAKYGHPRHILTTLREMAGLRLALWREERHARREMARGHQCDC